jgi:hypothetical protein
MFLFWIRFYYLVLFQVWLYERIEFFFLLSGYSVIYFEVEARARSPPLLLVVFIYVVLLLFVFFLLGTGVIAATVYS